METDDSSRRPGRHRKDRVEDRDPGEGQVSEVADLGGPDETDLGGADAVPETPDDNNPGRDVPRTPHGSDGNPPPD
ncbi:MAG TPA: hypothetical protein VK038_06775 [Ornithinicoccus sp.]|jgi:hypothetical protein|nr:hypothetical protein [Ornithinicoccus sp.]